MNYKEKLMLEVEALENTVKEYSGMSQQSQRQHDLMLGAILGLFLGIIGNFFVSVFYPIIQTMVLKEPQNSMFWANAVLSLVSFALIIGISTIYNRRLAKANKEDKTAQNKMEQYQSILKEKKQELESLTNSEERKKVKDEINMDMYDAMRGAS